MRGRVRTRRRRAAQLARALRSVCELMDGEPRLVAPAIQVAPALVTGPPTGG